MDKIYAELIRKDLKTLDDVPEVLKWKVEKQLNREENDR